MAAKIKVSCGKCAGKGTFNCYRHIKGGDCFSCDGRGYHLRTQRSIDTAAKKVAAREAARKAGAEKQEAEWNELVAKYAADPRVGPVTRAKADAHDVYAYNMYERLSMVDSGEATKESHPWILEGLAE